MAARAISSGTISFGLVSIPVKVYTAATSHSVHFNYLHEKCGSRLRRQLYCPVDDEVVENKDLVKGYEYAKNQYVRFTQEELRALEADRTNSIEIAEFIPLSTVDLIYVDKSYYLGPDKGGHKAYQLLTEAMLRDEKVAVGRYWTRGKEDLVLIRPYQRGLLLHRVYYADEVRPFDEVDRGDAQVLKPGELELAEQLIRQLSRDSFNPQDYRDEYRTRVEQAVAQKVAGQEVTVPPEQPAAQIIDLFDALKASLAKGAAPKAETKIKPPAKAKEKRTKPLRKADASDGGRTRSKRKASSDQE